MRRVFAALLIAVALPLGAQGGVPGDAGSLSGISQLAWRLIGDRFVWGDVKVRAGWRLQENGMNGRCRILDATEEAVVEGDCSAGLDSFQQLAPKTAPAAGPLVMLVHGLGGARMDFSTLRRDLKSAGIAAETIAYPSVMGDIASHARRLNAILNELGGRQPIVFVAHSMGGLVVRTALAEPAPWRKEHTVSGLLMVGPPNRGAGLARVGAEFSALLGPATLDLMPENAMQIPAPAVRYCVIAGGTGDGEGYNPAIPGDDDGVVGLEETRIRPDEDRIVLRANHRELLAHRETHAAIRRFVAGGRCAPL